MKAPANIRTQVRLVPVEGAVGIVLPPELLERLGLAPGDVLDLHEEESGFRLGAAPTDKLRALDRIMDEDAAILDALAR